MSNSLNLLNTNQLSFNFGVETESATTKLAILERLEVQLFLLPTKEGYGLVNFPQEHFSVFHKNQNIICDY